MKTGWSRKAVGAGWLLSPNHFHPRKRRTSVPQSLCCATLQQGTGHAPGSAHEDTSLAIHRGNSSPTPPRHGDRCDVNIMGGRSSIQMWSSNTSGRRNSPGRSDPCVMGRSATPPLRGAEKPGGRPPQTPSHDGRPRGSSQPPANAPERGSIATSQRSALEPAGDGS